MSNGITYTENNFDHPCSLRDYFAGQALAGQASFEGMEGCDPELWAECAYETADAMLAEREKEGE